MRPGSLGFAGGSGGGGSPPLGNTLEMVLIQLENSIWITYYKDIVNVQRTGHSFAVSCSLYYIDRKLMPDGNLIWLL
jgi:hypothetical protein